MAHTGSLKLGPDIRERISRGSNNGVDEPASERRQAGKAPFFPFVWVVLRKSTPIFRVGLPDLPHLIKKQEGPAVAF